LSGACRLLNYYALAAPYPGEVRLLEQLLQSGLRAAAPEEEGAVRDARRPPDSEGTQGVDPAERSPWHERRAEPLFSLLDLCMQLRAFLLGGETAAQLNPGFIVSLAFAERGRDRAPRGHLKVCC
jgi:hypothetical protein